MAYISNKPKIVITGGSGLLGHPLCRLAAKHYRVYAVCHRHRPQLQNIKPIAFDLNEDHTFYDFIEKLKPEALIHAAANPNVPYCENNPQITEKLNVHVPQRLAGLCAAQKILFIFTSTDLVFDGLNAPYSEENPPNPVGVYAGQKLQAEEKILAQNPAALVCRLPLLFGLSPHAQQNFMVHTLSAIADNRPVNLFVDEFRTPVDTYSAARGILKVMGRAQGVLHLGGRTRVSRYDMGRMMATAMGKAPDMLCGIKVKEAKLSMQRAPDCSMDSRKAYALGYEPTPIEIAVKAFVEDYFNR